MAPRPIRRWDISRSQPLAVKPPGDSFSLCRPAPLRVGVFDVLPAGVMWSDATGPLLKPCRGLLAAAGQGPDADGHLQWRSLRGSLARQFAFVSPGSAGPLER